MRIRRIWIKIKELGLKVGGNSGYIFINFFYINKSRKRLYIVDKNKDKSSSNNKVDNKGEDKREDEDKFIENLAI